MEEVLKNLYALFLLIVTLIVFFVLKDRFPELEKMKNALV